MGLTLNWQRIYIRNDRWQDGCHHYQLCPATNCQIWTSLVPGELQFIAVRTERMYFSCQQRGTVGNFSRVEITACCLQFCHAVQRVPVAGYQTSNPWLRKEVESDLPADVQMVCQNFCTMFIFLTVIHLMVCSLKRLRFSWLFAHAHCDRR